MREAKPGRQEPERGGMQYRLPCVKGAAPKGLRDCLLRLCTPAKKVNQAAYNPSVTASPCHLPLHKGGVLHSQVAAREPQRRGGRLIASPTDTAQRIVQKRAHTPTPRNGRVCALFMQSGIYTRPCTSRMRISTGST